MKWESLKLSRNLLEIRKGPVSPRDFKGSASAIMADPGYSFDVEFDDSRLFDGPGYIGISFSDGQSFGRIFVTNDVNAVYEMQIRQDCQERDISDEAVGKYVHEKIIRFSKANTVFGRIADEDLDKLEQLNKGTVINRIRFQ